MIGARPAAAVAIAVALTGLLPGVSRGQEQARPTLAPPEALERIVSLLERNDVAAARAAVDPALAAYPADPAVHNLAGVVAAQSGALEPAEGHFLTAIRLAPHSPAAYTNLGRLYQERSGTDPAARGKALDVYRRLLAFDASNVEGLYQSAFLLALDGDFALSRACLERLPAEVRSRPQALAVLSVDQEGAGDVRGARESVAAMARHADLSAADVAAVLPALARASEDGVLRAMLEALDTRALATPELRQRLAAIHVRQGRLDEAKAVLERAARPAPGVRVLLDLARVTYKLGDPKAALGYVAHARSLEPQNPQVHFLFGILCVALDLGGEAYESLKTAVTLDPDNPLVNYAMGAVSTHRRDPSEAVPYFEKYVRLMPDDPRGRFALGAARFYSRQLEDARSDLLAAARAPETATGAHFFLARIARQLNDLDTARREIDLALAANATYADAWAERGLIETRSGLYAEAEASLTKALSLEPDNYEATMNLAALYGRTRDPRRAEQEARLAKLIEKREVRMQDFLRLVQVVP